MLSNKELVKACKEWKALGGMEYGYIDNFSNDTRDCLCLAYHDVIATAVDESPNYAMRLMLVKRIIKNFDY